MYNNKYGQRLSKQCNQDFIIYRKKKKINTIIRYA